MLSLSWTLYLGSGYIHASSSSLFRQPSFTARCSMPPR